jgi:uncharacterized protein
MRIMLQITSPRAGEGIAALLRPIVLSLAILLLPAFRGALAADPVFPALSGRVVDEAGLLSAAERERLTGQLAAHEQATGQQVVVVTLRSLQGLPIEDFGYRLGRAWGIGEKGKSTGALLAVAPSEHAVRIEVGYGLEGLLTDALSRSIIERDILPAFRQGQFARGIVDGTSAMLAALGGSAAAPPRGAGPVPAANDDLAPLVFIAMILFFVAMRFYFFRGGGLWMVPGAGSWGGGSRGGFGGFSGGGFSGGGGSFGGGGASGTW